MGKVPRLRFKEFSGEWEEKKLGNVCTFFSGGTPTSSNKSYYDGNIPFIGSGKIRADSVDQYITEEALKNSSAKLVKKGDLLYALYGATSGEVAISKIDGAINQAVLCIRSQEEIYFLLQWLLLNKTNILSTYLQGGQGNLSAQIIKSLMLRLPVKQEQRKITSFLSVVDTKIDQLTRKKELIKQYKKGVLQKIFSQKLRFRADDGSEFTEWEEKDLKSIIDNFIVPMRDKPKDLSGSIPWCRIEDFDGKYLFDSKSNQGVSAQTVNEMNLKIYPIDALLVSCSADLGKCAIVKKELITNQTFIGLVPKHEQVNVEFLFYSMTRLSKVLNSLSSGTTISYLSRKEFEKFEINLPCLEEQIKIANFLSAIDTKIDLVAQQLDQAKNFKKALLQQMFV